LDHSAASSLSIKTVRSASAFAPNALKHFIDSYEEIRILTGATPDAPCNLHEFALERSADGTCASQRLQLPRPGAICVIPLTSFNRTNDWPFFPFGTQSRIERPNVTLSGRLRHRAHQLSRRAIVIANEQNVQICAVTDFSSAKFTKGDDGDLIGAKESDRE